MIPDDPTGARRPSFFRRQTPYGSGRNGRAPVRAAAGSKIMRAGTRAAWIVAAAATSLAGCSLQAPFGPTVRADVEAEAVAPPEVAKRVVTSEVVTSEVDPPEADPRGAAPAARRRASADRSSGVDPVAALSESEAWRRQRPKLTVISPDERVGYPAVASTSPDPKAASRAAPTRTASGSPRPSARTGRVALKHPKREPSCEEGCAGDPSETGDLTD